MSRYANVPPVRLVGDGLSVPCVDGQERPYLNLRLDQRGQGGGSVMRPEMTTPIEQAEQLPGSEAALAVVAHPDDESFGLGAVLSSLQKAGTKVVVLCLTHGEASSLGAEIGRDQLHAVRAAEMAAASEVMGLHQVEMHDYPDGHLASIDLNELAELVETRARDQSADLLVVFDEGGVTGHPDHIHATRAALVAAERLDLPVLAWAVREEVARALNDQFGTLFSGRCPSEIDYRIGADRHAQLAAIACHRSQSARNPVLWRRLELTGPEEPLRLLRARSVQP